MHEQAHRTCHPFDGDDAPGSGVIRRKWCQSSGNATVTRASVLSPEAG
jgi:hypothetical protein